MVLTLMNLRPVGIIRRNSDYYENGDKNKQDTLTPKDYVLELQRCGEERSVERPTDYTAPS